MNDGVHWRPSPFLEMRSQRECMMAQNVKQAVLEMIGRLPENVSIDDIMAELYFRQKVDEGLRQLDAGEGIEHEEAVKRLGKWLNA